MRFGPRLEETFVILCFLGLNQGENLTSFDGEKFFGPEAGIEVNRNGIEGKRVCCYGERNSNPVAQTEARINKNGEKHQIRIGEYGKLLKRREATEGEENRGKGLKGRVTGNVTSGMKSGGKRGNESRILAKQQKIFFNKKFRGIKLNHERKKIIYLLGLFDLTHLKQNRGNLSFEERYEERVEGRSEIRAANLAVGHVNERKLFGGYQLKMYVNDTKCDAGVAVDALFHALFSKSTPLPVLLGSACSLATASLASITPYWNIVQISFGTTSPILSNRKKFPMFYRIAAPDSSHDSAKLEFIRHFGWNSVTFISQNEKEYILAVNYFIKVLEKNNITCKGTVTFGKNNYQDQLQLLKDSDTRIIFGSFSEEIAPTVFCKVFELGVFGDNYAWILQGSLKQKWWKNQSECPEKNLKTVTQGVFFISSYYDPDQPHSFQTNFSSQDLKRELSTLSVPISRYARESYDAIWMAAIALNESLKIWSENGSGIRIEDFNYDRYDIAQTIFEEISSINSIGMSGPISFVGADRLGASAFYQLQGDDLVTIAIYLPNSKHLNFFCKYCKKVFWEGGQVPVSERFLLKRIETISFRAFMIIASCTTIAIVLAIFFLIFNSYFRKLKNIKLSSPKLNNITVTGCIAVYIGVFLLGLDYATLPNIEYYSIICTAKVYFFAAGFSLAFGSIFAKTYRVHKIFIKSQGGFIKKKFLQDRQLILLVGVLLLIDGLILTIWVVVDPLQRQLHNATIEYSAINRSVMYQPQVEICSCNHLNGWLSFLYMYKGLQLLMGVFLAWETRHVKVPGLNDSQYIVLSVYTVVITSCIVIVLANLIFERPTVAYVIISTMILSSTTATLCLLFFPKLQIIFSKSVDNLDPIMQSMGLTMESNTRRFMMDDAKDKLCRIEAQNRVYKREVFTLSNEISRLEKQLIAAGGFSPRNLHKYQTGSDPDIFYRSLLEISKAEKVEPFSQMMQLRKSWPDEIHKIAKPKQIQLLNSEFGVADHLKLNFPPGYIKNREQKKIFSKKAGTPGWQKAEQCEGKNFSGSRTHKKYFLSQYLPYLPKTTNEAKSIEDLRDAKFWLIDRSKSEYKSKMRRKSQTSSKIKFKGSPRFPHRIVPSNMFLSESNPKIKSLLGRETDKLSEMDKRIDYQVESVLTHQVEIVQVKEVEEDKMQ